MQRYFIESGEVASRLISREDGFSWYDGRLLDASGFLVHSELSSRIRYIGALAVVFSEKFLNL